MDAELNGLISLMLTLSVSLSCARDLVNYQGDSILGIKYGITSI